ncbi:MAG: hypothetical protein A2252_06295 [Elusimicrobia bacterium RIFOXYA2_FULL_39_19]|nr:MAG: hypothetical protein A2252_06295 [Elusimicrobia bacterium RIFOXYA2_FULL_39_19]
MNTEKKDIFGIGDFLTHAMLRGLLVPAMLFVCILLLIYKTPTAVVGQLILSFFHSLKKYSDFGYFLSIFIIIAWYLHINFINKNHDSELTRISNERNRLQELLYPGSTQSSKENKQ